LDLKGLIIADSKHKGLLPLVKGRTLHNFEVRAARVRYCAALRLRHLLPEHML